MLVAEHGTGAHSRAHRARLVVVRRDVASSIRKSRCWLDDLGVVLPRTDRGRRLSAGHCRPFSRSLMMKTISGSIVGWISFACGTGAPIGNTMSSVSQATIGESVPVRCCLARLVRPQFEPDPALTTGQPSGEIEILDLVPGYHVALWLRVGERLPIPELTLAGR